MKVKLKKDAKVVKVVFRKKDGTCIVINDNEIKKDKGSISFELNEYQKSLTQDAELEVYDMTGNIPKIIETGDNEAGDKSKN